MTSDGSQKLRLPSGLVVSTGKKGGEVRFKNKSKDVDIVFVIDTTGSMSSKIEALLQTCAEFLTEPAELKLIAHFLLIAFGDTSVQGSTDTIEVVVPLTDKLETMRYGLKNIPRNSGYSNVGETSLEALDLALRQQYRPTAVKVIILITDEPAVEVEFKPADITARLQQGEFICFTLTPRLSYFQDMATSTGGTWTEISASSQLSSLKQLLAELAETISKLTNDVHELAHGSVAAYLRLKSGQ